MSDRSRHSVDAVPPTGIAPEADALLVPSRSTDAAPDEALRAIADELLLHGILTMLAEREPLAMEQRIATAMDTIGRLEPRLPSRAPSLPFEGTTPRHRRWNVRMLAGSSAFAAMLLLALTAFHKPHLLILDEPTNHLDVDSREALIHALMAYEGAVILISHDRHLVAATADRLWLVKNGTVKNYDGDIDSYRAELLAERGARSRGNEAAAATAEAQRTGSQNRADQRRAAAERRAELAPLKKAMDTAEKTVTRLMSELGKLDALLADGDLYVQQPERAQKAVITRGQLAKQLETAEEEWLLAGEAYEQANADAERDI